MGEPKSSMEGSQCSCRLGGGNHHGNVSFGTSLSNCKDIDLGVSQCRKESARHPCQFLHAISDGGYNAAGNIHVNLGNSVLVEFFLEFFLDSLLSPGGIICGRRKRNAVLRRGLRNEHNIDSQMLERSKETLGNTLDSDQSRSLYVNQGYIVNARKAADTRITLGVGDARGIDACSTKARIKSVADVNWNLWVAGNRWLHCFRVNYLGTKVGELHGLVIGNLWHSIGFRNSPWIGTQDFETINQNEIV
mmetsp:Transcript_7235/g.17684  ORF Transcript_7235/g.17684 Transcript_7235/m.17684 type:complete len:248 (-) Transcript_7235:57-800(-)